MNRRGDGEPSSAAGDDELVLPHTKVDGWGIWIGAAFFFGGPIGFAAFTLSGGDAVAILLGLLILAGGLPIAAWLVIGGWQQATGAWWLRLSSTGFEVNDRLRPRHYRWADIEQFMLVDHDGVPLPAEAEVPPARSWGEVIGGGADATTAPAALVAFRCRPGRRRHPGRAVDGNVMGYWDRPFDEAVELMNEWLARSREADPR